MKNIKEFLTKRQTASDINNRLLVFISEYKKYKKENKKLLKILDIGCGKNPVLYDFKEKEDIYYGCDFYPDINKKINHYKMMDLNDEYLHKKFRNMKFDVIFCGEVIEHLFSPDNLLYEIRKLMNPESILILSTPNLSYYLNRLLLLFGLSPLFLESSSNIKLGRRYKALGQGHITEGHIRVFTYGALRDLLKLKGFEILKITPVSIWNFWPDAFMSTISKSFAPDNVFVLRKTHEDIHTKIDN